MQEQGAKAIKNQKSLNNQMIGEEFLQRIDNPESEKLQDLLDTAIKDCREKLSEEDIDVYSDNIKRFASTFYYDWEKDGKPDYVFLIQNPGPLQRDRHFGDEIYDLKESSSLIKRARVNREYFKAWLLRKNEAFSKNFLTKLKDHKLIEFGQWDKYIKNGDFFKDFYATDVVKYRTDTSEIDEKKGENAEVSFDEFLKEELSYIEPKLIFVFGRRAWNILRRKMDAVVEDEGKTIEGSQDAITDVHGYLFKSEKILETYILPLAHFSGRNNFLRDSYFQYLDKGLSNY